jgi:two-component system chemotaxis response regulator CheY
MVKASLTPLDLQFDEAANGLEAIERLAVSHFDAMVLDMNMPDMHGLEVIRYTRSYEQYQALPILVLTTRGEPEVRQEALSAGANIYRTKPFEPESLRADLRTLLGG